MKRIYFQLFILFGLSTLISCSKNSVPYTQAGDWAAEAQLNGPARSEAVSFVINNLAFVGTGWDGLNTRYSDFWVYDQSVNNWTSVASMPYARSSGIAFSANGEGFVGTGYDGFNYLNDFYQYDPPSNTWTQKGNFPGSPRYEAAAFGLNNLGYVGTGFDGSNALKDFYLYTPASDSWTLVPFAGNKRYGAVTFVYQNKGFLVTGVNSGAMQTDFWKFDLDSAKFVELRHINNYSSDSYDDGYVNIARWNAAAFVIGPYAYLSTGENGSLYTYTWQYDIVNDLWNEKTPFEGPATTGAVGFSLNITNPTFIAIGVSGGFIGTGRTATGQAGASDYLWQFYPYVTQNPNDNY